MRGFTVRLPVNVLNTVRDRAQEQGLTTGAYIRMVIDNALAETEPDNATIKVSDLRRLIASAAT